MSPALQEGPFGRAGRVPAADDAPSALPGPLGQGADLTRTLRLHQSVALQDVADGVGGEREVFPAPQLKAEASTTVASLVAQTDYSLLHFGRGSTGGRSEDGSFCLGGRFRPRSGSVAPTGVP
jgi:hypothetical protein